MLQAPDQSTEGSRTPGVRECGHGRGGRGERDAFALEDVPSSYLPHFHPRVSSTPGCWSRAVGCQPLPSAVQTAVKPFLTHFGVGRGFQVSPISLRGPLATLRDRN